LVVIRGTLNAQRFIQDVLEPVVIPFINHRRDVIYQQDNARPHVARITMDGLSTAKQCQPDGMACIITRSVPHLARLG